MWMIVRSCVANSFKEDFTPFVLEFLIPFFHMVNRMHEILHLLVVFVGNVGRSCEDVADSLEQDSGRGCEEMKGLKYDRLVFSLDSQISFSFLLEFSWILCKLIIEK
jgi:hypothetical protein